MANLCASSRARWRSFSASLFFSRMIGVFLSGVKISSSFFAKDMYGILRFNFLRTFVPAESCPFPPSITMRSGIWVNDLSGLCFSLS